jgi:outer membrane assembly lipoprotein YfiO
MKAANRYFLLCLIFLGSWGCAPKSAKLQKSIVPPDKTLFETGSDYLKKSQYIKARLTFQTLINTYPDSDMAAESYFSIADSYYDEGGTENLLNAEEQYKNYIVFFPTSPKAALALLKMISGSMKMMHAPDRDPQYSHKALLYVNRLLEQYPDNEVVPIVRQYKAEIEENLALGDIGVARFYADKKNIAGVQGRLKDVIDNYPDFSGMDDVLFQFAGNLEKTENHDEAAIYYSKIASGFPFSKHFEESKQRLAALKKSLPAVDENVAAVNKSHQKVPEGFSPLNVFVKIGKEFGFVGQPDRFDEAMKIVKDEKIKAAEAAGGSGGESDHDQQSDDAGINALIRKSADGKTQVSTVLGTDPENAQQNAQPNKVTKKKVVNKNKRQSSKKSE